jgi:peptidoglycan/xylan/chitin deacetylase (PgdA/CDA1 family)
MIFVLVTIFTDVVEGKVIVVFRYDDYSALSNTDFERNMINTFAEYRLPIMVGIIPYVCQDFHNPRPRDFRELAPLPPAKAALLKEGIRTGAVVLAQHGFSHQTVQNAGRSRGGFSEFEGLDLGTQKEKIAAGEKLLEEMFGIPIKVFAPPWNSYDSVTVRVLESLGFGVISADEFRRVGESPSGLKYLPATCNLVNLRDAILAAKESEVREAIVVVLFHAYEFLEVNKKRGRLSMSDLPQILKWIGGQKDVEVWSIADARIKSLDLGAERLNAYARFHDLEKYLPSFFRKNYGFHPPRDFLEKANTKALTMLAVTYLFLFLLGVFGAFMIGRMLNVRRKSFWKIIAWVSVSFAGFLAAYAFYEPDLSFCWAILSTFSAAAVLGFVASYLAQARKVRL